MCVCVRCVCLCALCVFVCNRKRERESACLSVRVCECESVYMRVCLLVLSVYMKVHNDSEQNAIQHKNTQHYELNIATLSKMILGIVTFSIILSRMTLIITIKRIYITGMPFSQCQ